MSSNKDSFFLREIYNAYYGRRGLDDGSFFYFYFIF